MKITKKKGGGDAKISKKSSQRVENIKQANAIEDKIDYVFNVLNNDTLACLVGGTQVEMLIDSGCQHNLITDKTWLEIKEKILKIGKEVKKKKSRKNICCLWK